MFTKVGFEFLRHFDSTSRRSITDEFKTKQKQNKIGSCSFFLKTNQFTLKSEKKLIKLKHSIMSDEEDYMSDNFLAKCVPTDVRPGLKRVKYIFFF
jgi:hypothetical protein